MENFVKQVDDNLSIQSNNHSFAIPADVLKFILPQWKVKLTFDISFSQVIFVFICVDDNFVVVFELKNIL